jgi:hypothetical protein
LKPVARDGGAVIGGYLTGGDGTICDRGDGRLALRARGSFSSRSRRIDGPTSRPRRTPGAVAAVATRPLRCTVVVEIYEAYAEWPVTLVA